MAGGVVGGGTILAIAAICAVFGAVVGFPFMHGSIDGIEGAALCALLSLWVSVPISLLAGGIDAGGLELRGRPGRDRDLFPGRRNRERWIRSSFVVRS